MRIALALLRFLCRWSTQVHYELDRQGLVDVCPCEEELYDAGQHAGQAGGGDGRSPGNRDRMRFDIDARRIIVGLLIEREDRRIGDAVG
jgi:hypothetical protein